MCVYVFMNVWMCVNICTYTYTYSKYISHYLYCFTNGISSKPPDYHDLFCIRNNCDYCLCEILSDYHEAFIILVKKVTSGME